MQEMLVQSLGGEDPLEEDPINCHGVDVIKDPLMRPILGHLGLGVAKEFSLDP